MSARPIHSAILILLLATACSNPPDSPEAQIRALIGRAEQAAEARDAEALRELLTENYRDASGRNAAETERLLQLYFFRNRQVRLLLDIESIELVYRDFARVQLVAGMAGDDGGLLPRAGAWRFALELTRDAGEWRVSRAEWQRANAGNLL